MGRAGRCQSIDAIHAAVDHGINWIDTAPIYGSGHSEEVVGRAVKAAAGVAAAADLHEVRPRRRQRRAGPLRVGAPTWPRNATPACAGSASITSISISCTGRRRSRSPRRRRPAQALLTAGKIRAIGVSNFSVAQLEEWRATGVPLHTDQPPFSILRPAVKHDVLPWCAAHDVGAISYSPLFRGLLFGTWTKDKTFPADDGRSTHKDYAGRAFPAPPAGDRGDPRDRVERRPQRAAARVGVLLQTRRASPASSSAPATARQGGRDRRASASA